MVILKWPQETGAGPCYGRRLVRRLSLPRDSAFVHSSTTGWWLAQRSGARQLEAELSEALTEQVDGVSMSPDRDVPFPAGG